jgi:hypothetical protein
LNNSALYLNTNILQITHNSMLSATISASFSANANTAALAVIYAAKL